MYCKGDYQLRNGIAHEDQAQWPCSPGVLAVQNGNPEAVEEDDGEGGRSILERLRKWICLGRERHMEVGFSEILLQGVFFFYLAPLSHLQFSPQGTAATIFSTIEDYLRLPLEQCKCLRFAIMN